MWPYYDQVRNLLKPANRNNLHIIVFVYEIGNAKSIKIIIIYIVDTVLGSERAVSSHLRKPRIARDQVHGYLRRGIRSVHLVMSLILLLDNT